MFSASTNSTPRPEAWSAWPVPEDVASRRSSLALYIAGWQHRDGPLSTSDRGQTVENQLQPLRKAARRLGWIVVAVFRDEGISGTKGRDGQPGVDAQGRSLREPPINGRFRESRLVSRNPLD